MRRELIWVVVIGITFGLIIAFGVWRVNSSLEGPKSDGPTPTPDSQNSEVEFKITLSAPENNDVVTVSPVTVSGITKPLTWIVASGEAEDYILQSDDKGIFTQDVALEPGINRIGIAAFDPAGSQSVQKVLVVYSSVFQLKTATSPLQDAASGSSAIREKVAQKVAAAMDQPKAYLGVVTDITSSTIQIKNPESQIEQIAIGTDGISVVNAKGTTSKAVKLSDIAIGDFIVAMGYVNGDGVLKAQRILITDPLEDSGLKAFIGKVVKTTVKTITVTDAAKGEESIITPGKNTVIKTFAGGKTVSVKMASIETDDLIIYVMDTSGTSPFVRSIFGI
ncbi:MAG: hypothetical protein UV71_C0012G0006 [Microgenomates group bacterium GW2011_GWC1_43_13]|uniref:DUF5666 domain-containing protein n=3 Tax=Candidatus Woeseibacteriota TaxID=1752722 RepID=A0A837I998_9BACT|nr:MAG: hypothetical protein UV71_C0012G0006 [Microgenomates group bacterium GW2011_GWC1_43_13]KKT33084.1 MAG: hypothetical protein UW20_C0005G0016 [Candidatus Woesebacteria bacterium GW2011_GWB1_44_11]KKT54746.1 MAG: hypothetical protein UW47_C0003G0015 [Candidatus Woesebacteria bacterium GW2011_GWA1_44_23]OGM76345.1 MAG: hypothetical protein A2208_01195 [Candidatus Woesebacteria bacterium RIFOXYA1_FULL_43_16]OGM81522.1 MAG: hypothetical protein A2394_00995 [Candidatus Woesebacteria bacterium 